MRSNTNSRLDGYLKPFERLEVVISDVQGYCAKGLNVGDVFTFKELIPSGLCPLFYHSAVPYLQTFLDGGQFKFELDREKVVVGCPNPKVAVKLELRKNKQSFKRNITCQIKSCNPDCPMGYKGEERWEAINDGNFCFQAYDEIFPDILKVIYGTSYRSTKSCASCVGTVTFSITKKNDRKNTRAEDHRR